MFYIAIIHKDSDSDYGVSFPDLPGCISAGESLEEARENAEEALALHIEAMQEDGEALPNPSTLDGIQKHRDFKNSKALLAIECPAVKEKTVRIQVTLRPSALAAIDAAANEKKMSRSRFLVESALVATRAQS